VSTSLYVSNLSPSTTEEMLAGTFEKFGTVLSVKLKRDPETGRMHRYGFIEMKTAAEAQKAERWACLRGFVKSAETGARVEVPANAFLDSTGRACRCERGFVTTATPASH
jgi:hypothetical protein